MGNQILINENYEIASLDPDELQDSELEHVSGDKAISLRPYGCCPGSGTSCT